MSLAVIPARARGDGGGFELGVLSGAHLFSNDGELGVRDWSGAPELDSFALVGARLGYGVNRWAGVEGEFVAIPTSDSNDDTATVLGWRAHALFHFAGGKVRPFVALGGGGFTVMGAGELGMTDVKDDSDLVAHYGAGVKVDLTRAIGIRLDGRHLFMPSKIDDGLTNDFEVQLGVAYRFGTGEAPIRQEVEVSVAPTDTDGDGLNDDVDKCLREAEDRDGFQDDDGCADPDNDGDGKKDEVDKCPLEAETLNGVDDDDGCPETDPDGDGLFGSADKCADQPEDKDAFEDEDGCPDPDNAGDGVADANDKCPAEKETANGFQDDDGCPDTVPANVAKFTGTIQGIFFKKNSDEITRKSFRTLNKAATIMKEYPDLKIEISGHTSSEGELQHNMDLSQRRAESVKAYLVGQGVDGLRINTVGYGPEKPIADDKTRKGKEKNRRIEFRLISDQVK